MTGERPAPDSQEAVRGLLAAAAREPEPVPRAVAARLDRVLDDLRIEQQVEGGRAAGRQRRPTLLVAAATVALLALGVGVGLRTDDSAPTSAGQAVGPAAPAQQSTAQGPTAQGPTAQGPTAGPGGTTAEGLAGPQEVSGSAGLPRLHTRRFAAGARRLAASATDTPGSAQQRAAAPARSCAPRRLPPGAATVPVLLDGSPAVLVYGPVRDGVRAVAAYACGRDGYRDGERARRPVATASVTVH